MTDNEPVPYDTEPSPSLRDSPAVVRVRKWNLNVHWMRAPYRKDESGLMHRWRSKTGGYEVWVGRPVDAPKLFVYELRRPDGTRSRFRLQREACEAAGVTGNPHPTRVAVSEGRSNQMAMNPESLSVSPDALAGAVERVQCMREARSADVVGFKTGAAIRRTDAADARDIAKAQYMQGEAEQYDEYAARAQTDVDALDLLLSCAASHVPEADREQALWHALRAECSDDCHEAEARKLLRLPSKTEQG